LQNTTKRDLLKQVWALTKPYWFSEEKWVARGLLFAIVSLNLGLVYVNVLINAWNNDFYNTLQNLDKTGFFQQLVKFAGLATVYIVIAVYQIYLNQMLQIRWRRWLTGQFLQDWTQERAYYRLQLKRHTTDNPDQRIADDLGSFCEATLSLSLGLLSAIVTLVSFITILWGLSGTLSFALFGSQWNIPGYLVWVALLYALGGTFLINRIGHPLIGLNFNQQKYEANFRFSLIRFRENTEAIALYHGEKDEVRNLKHLFGDIADNWWSIMKRTKMLTWFRAGYNQTAVIFPFLVASPRFFSGAIKLGGLMQIASAFGQVQEASSWIINAYTQIAAWRATVERIITFRAALDRTHQEANDSAAQLKTISNQDEFAFHHVKLDLPDGRNLQADVNLQLKKGEHTLITGASGCGKSTLFRALSGIWPFAKGEMNVPKEAKTLFLPQKPYLGIGSLRAQLAFPSAESAFNDADYERVLNLCGMSAFSSRLDEHQHWAQILSGGEQQRIALARALLQKPDWLFMDEASAALDESMETDLYRMLQRELPDTTMVSIGHRTSLEQVHHRVIRLT
jgi:vitamin B12/bleomycin/antimicrobial peptide transport system ATP-binding/permease protein